MLFARCLLYFVASLSCYRIIMKPPHFAVFRQYNMLCKEKRNLAICTEFVNYCEHGRLSFSDLHFELRCRVTSFTFKVWGRGSLNSFFYVCVHNYGTVILFDRLTFVFSTASWKDYL